MHIYAKKDKCWFEIKYEKWKKIQDVGLQIQWKLRINRFKFKNLEHNHKKYVLVN